MQGSDNANLQQMMPDLRIVPLRSVIAHEEHDAQRSAPLVRRIQESGVWLNPPIVAEMDQQCYVILDGANRHYSLGELGYPYILVQVVDYESSSVRLETWHHIVSGLSEAEFIERIQRIVGLVVEKVDRLNARAALAQREVLAYAVTATAAYTMQIKSNTLADRTAALRQIVDTYKQRGTLNRTSTDSMTQARKLYPDASAIVVFPHYQPVEILVAARNGVHLPPGITRHIIQGRAMRLNYPLEALRDNGESLEEKNEQLRLWLVDRLAERRVRFYAESTFLFDE